MVDLVSQYQKIKPEVDIAIENVMNSAAFINGPEVQSFKSELQEYLNVKHVIPCANGTDALQVAMMGLELKPGDEVIVPTFTYVATAEVIALLQLTPVLVDVDAESFMISPEEIDKAIFNLIENRRVEFDTNYKELHARINKIHQNLTDEIDMSQKRLMCEIKTLASNLDGRIGVFEKYRWIIIGAAIVLGLSMPQILSVIKII